MSLGHARPKLTHMPHLLAQAAAEQKKRPHTGPAPEPPCEVRGKVGAFGFNNFRHAPELAVFACHEHRAEVEASLI